jgi:hypothetical protein
MDGGVGESLLLDNVLTGAAVGGGLSALTGGNVLTGALTGGLGGGIKGLLPDFSKVFMPGGATGTDVAGAASAAPAAAQAGQAYMGAPSILGQGGNYGFAADAAPTALTSQAADSAITTPAAATNPAAINQAAQSLGNPPSPTAPTQTPSPNVASTQPNPADIINKNNLNPIGLAPTNTPDGTTLPNGNYVMNGMQYSGKDITSAMQPSLFQKYKLPILAGGAGLAYLASQRPKMPTLTQASGPQFGLASNYQPLSNPTPVYPRFAQGGIAQLADGGSMMSQPANVNFMGNDMYPQSQQQTSFYASPTQMPTSAQQTMASYEPKTNPLTGEATATMAHGGIAALQEGGTAEAMQEAMANKWLSNLPDMSPTASAKGGMLKGPGDGMSDSIPGTIGGVRPARLADGEFVVPADVVSHLGNGSTDAGAKQLYAMMDKVRQARTGKKAQGKQINPGKYMPA